MLLTTDQKETALSLLIDDQAGAREYLINSIGPKGCSDEYKEFFAKGFFKGMTAANEITEHFLNTRVRIKK